jgi:hypothetical protein
VEAQAHSAQGIKNAIRAGVMRCALFLFSNAVLEDSSCLQV